MVVVSKIKLDIQLDYAKGLEIVDWKCSLFQPCVTEDNHQAQQKYCWNVKKENVFSCQDDETVKIDHQHANDNIQKSAAQTCACKSYRFDFLTQIAMAVFWPLNPISWMPDITFGLTFSS